MKRDILILLLSSHKCQKYTTYGWTTNINERVKIAVDIAVQVVHNKTLAVDFSHKC